jgi:hypothetical protein
MRRGPRYSKLPTGSKRRHIRFSILRELTDQDKKISIGTINIGR